MKKYFEFKNESSSKFWEISIEKSTITTRYGKIGTAGKSAQKELASEALAEKEYQKLIKSKVKKGYEEIILTASSYKESIITEKEARQRFKLLNYIQGTYGDEEKYLLWEGDVVIDKDLVLPTDGMENIYGIIVTGNLTVKGVLYQPEMDYGPTLLVLGNLVAQSINKGGSEFYIKGNVSVEQTIYGYYNHGMLTVKGDTSASVIFAEDHFFKFKGDVSGLVIDTGTIKGTAVDFTTTKPLLPKLVNNDHYSESNLLNDYINAGKSIVRKKYLPKAVVSTIEKKNAYTVKIISNEEAIQQFNLKDYDPFGSMGFEYVLLLEGDSEMDGNLDYGWYQKEAKKAKQDGDYALILVDGNLVVHGDISPGADSMPFLFVTGNVTCDVLKSYDECIYIQGDATIKYAFDGNYNDGSIVVDGITRVPYILNSDHCSELTPEGAILINYYSDYDDFFEYDYTVKDFERVMRQKVLDEDDELDQHAFIDLLRAGKNPLKKGAKPARQLFEEELAKIIKKKDGEPVTSINLKEKKFSAFPKDILRLTDLKKLVFSNNAIDELPENIHLLTNLEELYLESCSLTTLPASIGKLKNLRILDVSRNASLVLPDSLNELENLEELYLQYNKGFGLPKKMDKLKKLRVLNVYQCSDEKPIDFPEVICSLTGLEHLDLGSNSFKTIPDSFLNLKELQYLKLGASLCYLNELPDLSGFTKLKNLSADGLISYTTRPQPKQSLLKSFFDIESLEILGIDRHGQSKNIFKNKDLERLLENLEYDPARQAAMKAIYSKKENNRLYGTIWEGIPRKPLTVEHLEGIGKLKNLKELDLSFNGLEQLPEELFSLEKLEKINLTYNDNLSMDDLKRLYETFPNAKINAKKIKTRVDLDDDNFKAVNALVKEAASKMRSRVYQESIALFEEALELCTPGEKYSEYDELYAYYGVCYNLAYLLVQAKAGADRDKMVAKLIRYGKKAFEDLIPKDASIWYYTEEGAFQRECIRTIGNSLGWHLFSYTDEVEILEEALHYAERASKHVDGESHFYILDTLVRILLKLDRKEEAYAVVAKTLRKSPAFGDFQDIKQNKGYKKWLKART